MKVMDAAGVVFGAFLFLLGSIYERQALEYKPGHRRSFLSTVQHNTEFTGFSLFLHRVYDVLQHRMQLVQHLGVLHLVAGAGRAQQPRLRFQLGEQLA